MASVNNEQIIWDLLAHLRQDRVTHQELALQHFPWKLMAVFCGISRTRQYPVGPLTDVTQTVFAFLFRRHLTAFLQKVFFKLLSVGGKSGDMLMRSARVFKLFAPASHWFLIRRSLKWMITSLSAWRLRRWHAAKSVVDASLTCRHSWVNLAQMSFVFSSFCFLHPSDPAP